MSSATLQVEAGYEKQRHPRLSFDFWLAATYAVLLAISSSVWFLAIWAPLWVDETLSYWQIAGTFRQIWQRSIEGNSFAAYAYILWFARAVFGSTEVALRIPSLLATFAAAYVLYRCARELFPWDVSLAAVFFFILPRAVAFAAIDVRPYCFALLLSNLTILAFLRWRKSKQTKYAVCMGVAGAGILYFHYLFATVIVALVIYYGVTRGSALRTDLRQISVALGCFVILMIPVLPRLWYIFQTRASHSYAAAPEFVSVLRTLNPGKGQWFIVAGFVLVAAVAGKLALRNREKPDTLFLCGCLALIPIACLYAISVFTSVHVFLPRYLLAATPGIALFWGWFSSRLDSRSIRVLFCVTFVTLCVVQAYSSTGAYKHQVSWKAALKLAEENAARDGAPLLMCSPYVEADFQPMPAVPSESALYAPLSYYRVKAAIVPLPRTLNGEADRRAQQFLLQASQTYPRFIVMAQTQSLAIVDRFIYYSQGMYTYRVLSVFDDDVWVVEFVANAR